MAHTETPTQTSRDFREIVGDRVLQVGTRVFCYYLEPEPSARSLGTITSGPDEQGWYDVTTDTGHSHYFDNSRLAVAR